MQADKFYLFGPDHWYSVAFTILASITFILIFKRLVHDKVKRDFFSRYAGWTLILYEIAKAFLRPTILNEAWQVTFPLNLCQLTNIALGVMLITRGYRWFEIAYFWAIGGGTMAVLTPDLAFGFPDPQYLMHTTTHTLIYIGIFYGLMVLNFRPTWHSVKISFGTALGLMVIIFPLNYLLGNGANYLYLRYRPQAGSLLDFLPQPPWHVPYVIVIAMVIYLLAFLPFMFRRKA